MSLDATQKKINKAEEDLKKHKKELEKKLSKLLTASGILELDMSEKDLKVALKHFVTQLKQKTSAPKE